LLIIALIDKMDAHKKPVEIWQQFDKLLIVLNFKNK
jgi:hypothetical protein